MTQLLKNESFAFPWTLRACQNRTTI